MPIKILAVDDSLTMRQALEITFAGEDAEIITLEKGSELVERAKAERPDIILVDARLSAGDVSGADVCSAIRADSDIGQTPILWMMPDREGVSEQKAKNVGANAAIGKPFDSQAMIDTVASVCDTQIQPTARAAAAPAAASASRAAAPARPVASKAAPRSVAPKAAPANRQTPAPAAARPAPSKPAVAPAAASAASPSIPLAVPIPFTSASNPTSGMLARIQAAAQGQAASDSAISPEAMKALAALSHEVVEKIAWEVVPELAESILREQSAERSA